MSVSRPERRRAIGFLVDVLVGSSYREAILGGMSRAAAEAGADLVTFVGGAMGIPDGHEALRNAVYRLVGPECVDAAAVLTTQVGIRVGRLRLSERLRDLGVPVVSVGAVLDEFPSVAADNAGGVTDLVRHLVEAHGRRRLAFVRGIEGNANAEERFQAFRRALESLGAPFDPALVRPGRFSRLSGVAAARSLFGGPEGGPKPDAVVAANDLTALGVIEELDLLGFAVPEDVSVVGFDAIEEGRLAEPPLTTARQPMAEQGRLAVELALRGEAAGRTAVRLPVETRLRRSCGCGPPSAGGASPATLSSVVASHGPHLLATMLQALGARTTAGEARAEWAERLVDALASDAARGEPEEFPRALAGLFSERGAADADIRGWLNALRLLHAEVAAVAPAGAGDLLKRLWAAAQPAAVAARRSARAAEMLDEWRATQADRVSWLLASARDIEDLLGIAGQRLPELGFRRAFVSLYAARPTPGRTSRLVLAVDPAAGVYADPEGVEFPSGELMPEAYRRGGRRELVVMPLCVGPEELGFVVLEAGPAPGPVYEQVRARLSAGLASALALRAAREEVERLRRELEELARGRESRSPGG